MVLASSRTVSMIVSVLQVLLGNSSDASRVMKGMRMAGRMGGDRVKVKSLKIVKIFPEKNYILVSGSVPGHNGSIVYNSEVSKNF